MRIAIVTHRFMRNEGQGRINYELAKHLAKGGYEIHLYAIEAEEDLRNMKNVHFHHIPVPNLPHILKDQIFMLFCTMKLRRKDYDMLHITGANAVHRYHINNCQFCHTAWKGLEDTVCYEDGPAGPYHRFCTSLNSFLEKIVYKKSGVITAASGKIKKELIDYLGVSKERIYVLYNGVDTEEFTPVGRTESRKRILEELGLSEEDILVLFVGDLRLKRKGAQFLLSALQGVKNEKVKLLLVGPQREAHYGNIVGEHGSDSRVIVTGFREDTADLYRASDMFVFPSLYEACSISVLEAMASGLPCVVSRETGTAEIMQNGVNGIILNSSTDANEICREIELLAGDTEKRERMGEKAREKAQQYTWERMARECEERMLSLNKQSFR